ncbi:hypothetical protein L6452_31773 [Arctium lappa]|uniref:Uncharacterized protein n=1 Tax=Arctium lappa TaxID=4217 RepID=A0ACB8Z2T0_ARCLA|nr:hypothetical protein L6452_31773 [Arctium lappa]
MANNHNYKNDCLNTKSISSSSYSGYKSKPSVTFGLRRNSTGSGGNSAGGHQKDTPGGLLLSMFTINYASVCDSCVFSEEWRWGFIRFRKEIEFGERKPSHLAHRYKRMEMGIYTCGAFKKENRLISLQLPEFSLSGSLWTS